MVFIIYKKYAMMHHWEIDRVYSSYMIVPCLLMAIAFHSNLNESYFADIRWAFAEYLESVSLFPMIYIMHKLVMPNFFIKIFIFRIEKLMLLLLIL